MTQPLATCRLPLATRSAAICCALLLAADAARADALKIENVTVAPRDGNSATVTFDISWSNSWRHGIFHDAAWVFFKARADGGPDWKPVRLLADPPSASAKATADKSPGSSGAASTVVKPAGYGQAQDGTPLEFVVPAGRDGFLGMFVRRAADGKGAVQAHGVTAVWDSAALARAGGGDRRQAGERVRSRFRALFRRRAPAAGITKDPKVHLQAFGIEMVYVAEGPFYLGSGGKELNRFYRWSGDGEDNPPYRVTSAGAIPAGRREGRLWAAGIAPPEDGEIPAAFPNGYAAFYCMKYLITQGQYADFLNTVTAAQAKERFYINGQGRWIDREGESPNYTYSASGRTATQYTPRGATDRDQRCPWLSWADCLAFAAWTGLRPMTELEYEKAIRGPRYPVPRDRSSSYWGIPDLNGSLLYERPVSAGSVAGLRFAGTHGRGTLAVPEDWPADSHSAVFRGDFFHMRRYAGTGHLSISGRSNSNTTHAHRKIHPFSGWRGVRSAPAGDAAMAPIAGRIPEPRLPRRDRPLRVDGVPDGWGDPLARLSGPADLFPVQRRFVPPDDHATWQGPGDLDARVYLAPDGEALFVGAVVTDDRHANTNACDAIGNGDSLRMGLVDAAGVQWDLALALTANGVVFRQREGMGETLLKTADCAVERDEAAKITRYGLRLPLAALGMKSSEEFGFNIVFFDDDDGNGQRYWVQLAPGLAGGSDPERYPRFVTGE